MKDHELYRPAVELEIAIVGETLCVRMDRENACDPLTFRLTEERRRELRQKYFELDQLARQPEAIPAYRQKEEALGRELAALLLGTDGTAEPSAALAARLTALQGNDYVRLLLRIDTPELVDLPWELALWKRPGTDEQIHLGRDARIALSRLEHGRGGEQGILREDGILSIFNIGADSSRVEATLYEHTREFLRLIDEHIPRLHTASRPGADLERYFRDSVKLTGQEPEIDIVHWRGHGGGLNLGVAMGPKTIEEINAAELFERTRRAFLYVVIACESGGAASGSSRPASFSAALLNAGASAVLGTHDAVAREEFAYLPIFYPLLFQGVPLDYCVQYLRRFFTLMNGERERGPYDRWYKLILRTTSTWYLDGPPAITPSSRQGDPLQFVPVLRDQLMRVLDAPQERRMREIDAVLTKL
jgi:hypothetical protein